MRLSPPFRPGGNQVARHSTQGPAFGPSPAGHAGPRDLADICQAERREPLVDDPLRALLVPGKFRVLVEVSSRRYYRLSQGFYFGTQGQARAARHVSGKPSRARIGLDQSPMGSGAGRIPGNRANTRLAPTPCTRATPARINPSAATRFQPTASPRNIQPASTPIGGIR